MGKIKDFFRKHKQQKEVSLQRDFDSSLAQAYDIFETRAHHFLDRDAARRMSRAFLYQCEDARKNNGRFGLLPENIRNMEEMTLLEFRINFLSYADELVNMSFDSERELMEKMQYGNEVLQIFEYHIITLEMQRR